MKIEKIKYSGVKPDGSFKDKMGSVETDGRIIMSSENGGCRTPGCRCSPGHWISISTPRSKGGIVEVTKVLFENKNELDQFLKLRELIGEKKK